MLAMHRAFYVHFAIQRQNCKSFLVMFTGESILMDAVKYQTLIKQFSEPVKAKLIISSLLHSLKDFNLMFKLLILQMFYVPRSAFANLKTKKWGRKIGFMESPLKKLCVKIYFYNFLFLLEKCLFLFK
jgi:predicted Kef-type K+ transport protein